MKKLYVIILIAFIGSIAKAQTPTWVWSKDYAGPVLGGESAEAIVNDKAGHLIFTGAYISTSINFGGQTVTNAGGNEDVYVVKADTNDNVIWAKSFGGNQDDWPLSITTDPQGNIYVAGWYKSTSIAFGSITLTNDSAGTGYNEDMFLVKLSPSGNVIWAKSWGGKNTDEIDQIIYEPSSNAIYACGIFKSTSLTIGSNTLTNDTTNNSSDVFIAKYDTAGNPLWVKNYGGTNYDYCQALGADATGNVFVCGYFGSKHFTIGTYNFTLGGGQDLFIIKYNSAGNIVWAKQQTAGGISNLECFYLAVDNTGNFYVTGNYGVSVTFGSTVLNTKGASDAYITAFDNNGNILWANNIGSTFSDFGKNICIDDFGNIVTSGWFGGATLYIDTTTYTSHGSYDCYVIKYAPNGSRIWSVTYGGNNFDYCNGLTLSSNSVYVAGKFLSSSITFGTNTINDVGGADIFVAKLNGSQTTGLTNYNIDKNIIVFPNPTSNQFFIETNTTGKLSVDLYDVNGRHVLSKSVSEKTIIDTAPLNEGVYTLTIKTVDRFISKRLVIVH